MRTNAKFNVGQQATIIASGERGLITGQAEYVSDETQYQLRYVDARGCAVERWWPESALQASA